MFTMTFTIERHIEELRAELRGCIDPDEAAQIRTDIGAALQTERQLDGEAEATT